MSLHTPAASSTRFWTFRDQGCDRRQHRKIRPNSSTRVLLDAERFEQIERQTRARSMEASSGERGSGNGSGFAAARAASGGRAGSFADPEGRTPKTITTLWGARPQAVALPLGRGGRVLGPD